MGQKPVHIRAAEAKGKPYGRRAIWLAFRAESANGPVDLLTLAVKSGTHKATVRTYMESLVKGGYAGKTRTAAGLVAYTLLNDTGVEHPRLNKRGEKVVTNREVMWKIMKVLSRFSARELVRNAGMCGKELSPVDAADYCKHLHKAGYLALSGDVYTLLPSMRTGPLAPMVQRVKVVFDPNLNRVMAHEDMEP